MLGSLGFFLKAEALVKMLSSLHTGRQSRAESEKCE